MKLLVKRDTFTDDASLGNLFIDGMWFCYTLEPKMREIPDKPVSAWKVKGKTAIPVGAYPVTMEFSPHFARILPHINCIPGFESVMLHPLNKPSETEGCIGVGFSHGKDSIADSRNASDTLNARIQAAIDRGDEVAITVENARA